MKPLPFLLLLVCRLTLLPAANDTIAISKVYVHQSGQDNLYVLQLKDGGVYDYSRYTNKRAYHDNGLFMIRHGKIQFVSQNHKHGFNSVGGKTYYISKKGLHKTKFNALMRKDAVLEFSDDPRYWKSRDFNPLTGKYELPEESKTANQDKREVVLSSGKSESIASFAKHFYLAEVEMYAPSYKSLLETNYCGPDCYKTVVNSALVAWNQDTSNSILINDFGTVIHESTHQFNSGSYLVVPGVAINVTNGASYKSCEFKKIVPEDAGTRIFRYGVYVSDSAVVSANVYGVFGLLDEFSAYENGTRADIIAAESALEKGDTTLARNFLTQAKGTYFAWYEFNLFIAWYLHYAKEAHPDIYKSTMENTNLRVAYTLINQEFETTVGKLKKTAKAAKGGDTFMDFYEATYVDYPKKLLVKEQSWLDAFAMKGVTQQNYKDYLK